MTGKKQQTINDILSNKKLRDQNAYVEVINQDVLETVQWVPGCLSVTAVGAWGVGVWKPLRDAHYKLAWLQAQGLKPRNRQRWEGGAGGRGGSWEPEPRFLPIPIVPYLLLT